MIIHFIGFPDYLPLTRAFIICRYGRNLIGLSNQLIASISQVILINFRFSYYTLTMIYEEFF